MPSLGADMDHGKVVEWLVKPGDAVHRGDLVAVVDTDKTVMDVESFEDGVVGEYLVGLGETVPVGTPIVRLGQGGAAAEEPAEPGGDGAAAEPAPAEPPREVAAPPASLPAPSKPVPSPRTSVSPLPIPSPTGPRRIRSSPLARRLAAKLGIDLEAVVGTGQQGSVSEADVRRAAEAAARPVPSGSEAVAASSAGGRPAAQPPAGKAATLRAALGSLMAKSKATVPHYYLSTTVDLSATMALMQERNLTRPVSARLVPAAFLLKAAAVAAREVPAMNGYWTDSGFAAGERVHLGVAVALRGGGLVAPALHDADALPVDELMEKLRDLVARARAGRLLRTEMADATITVTSLGDLGVEAVFGVIVPPQVAMVGFGRVVERPWAENGMLGVRQAVTATLSADHRVSDGLGGGRYLTRIQELLLTPEEL
ncbi:pyruvate dehydrogenase complex dihydrolipoamide acetyltransferase [Sinomonas flava]|uniref:Dihydrolipoamide acetyltransferase component of pyruvate dehydrogenase complex n=2 Tax=Sinomonas flava TaxID=496857 RepID=A0ABN3BMD1_9MICC